jgi:hypothetical protein
MEEAKSEGKKLAGGNARRFVRTLPLVAASDAFSLVVYMSNKGTFFAVSIPL